MIGKEKEGNKREIRGWLRREEGRMKKGREAENRRK